MAIVKRSPLLGLAAVALAGVTALAGCDQQQQGGMPPQGPAKVGIVTLEAQAVPITRELSGRTAAFQVAEIRPQVDGLITSLLFEEGAEVAAGAPLYQIDPATYQAAVDSAEAALARAEATLEVARLSEKRYAALVQTSAVSRQNYDDAVAARKQAEADVAAAKASLAAAKINLDRAEIKSPIAGRIGRSAVTRGALVTTNQASALATVQQLDPIYVDVTQSSADLLRLKAAMADGKLTGVDPDNAKVTLVLEDGSTYPLQGTLKFSETLVAEGTGTVTLRAVFPNPKAQLLPGMFVRAVVQVGIDEHGILAPQQGITRTPTGKASALVVEADGTAGARIVIADQAVGDKWLITDGLKPGDKLIVDGLQKVRPGAKVDPVPATLAASGAPTGPATPAQ